MAADKMPASSGRVWFGPAKAEIVSWPADGNPVFADENGVGEGVLLGSLASMGLRAALICPECQQGKHSICIGWTLDKNDRMVDCECSHDSAGS
jgi:hypothetical protein